MSARSFLTESQSYRLVRTSNYRGPTSRGGRRLSSTPASPASSSPNDAPAEPDTPASGSDLWARLTAAAGGDRQAELAVACMQRHVLEMVEGMPIDEIELLAGE